MTTQTYATPTLDTARAHIAGLFDAFCAATGLPISYVGTLTCGDPKFSTRYQRADFVHGTYDRVNSRLSAVWPEGIDWPCGIPRQAPAEIEEKTLDDLNARLSKIAARAASAQKHHHEERPNG